jgi:molybdenum cofactor guanylyltransferase
MVYCTSSRKDLSTFYRMNTALVSGVVLAGGGSKRFGSDKRLAIVNGSSLLAGACSKMSAVLGAGARIGVSISAEGTSAHFFRDVLVPALRGSDLTASNYSLIPDKHGDSGPLGGILSAHAELDTEWLLVLPVDLPNVSIESLLAILSIISKPGQPSSLAVIAEGPDGQLQPLVGCFNKSIIPYIKTAVSGGNLSVRRLLDSLERLPDHAPVVRHKVSEFELHNVNFAGDVRTDTDRI